MATIGTFQKKADGSYAGVVQTALIKLSAVFRPVESGTENGPDFRVFAGIRSAGEIPALVEELRRCLLEP